MSYDFHGSYESKLGHNSPLYERSDETSSEKRLNQVEFMFKRFYVHQQTNTNVDLFLNMS